MEEIGGYALKTTTTLSFDAAIDRATALLKEQGFGVLTEIDVQATLKKKLDMDYKPYRILGACNPNLAHQALDAEQLVGVLLPCNVVIWDEGDHRVVAAMEPKVMGKVIADERIREIAAEVSKRLHQVIGSI